jgi:small subunit ribosomal protein S18
MARMNSMGREDRRESRDRDRDRVDIGALKQRRSLDGVKAIDNRDYDLLGRFVTEFGKILPARLTGASPKQQRQIKRSVRRARNIGIMA